MQLPEWVSELAFPAQSYARRRRHEFISERSRPYHLAHSEQVTASDADQTGPDDDSFRMHAMRDHRLARITTIANDQEELIHAKAEDLMRTGAAEISTSAGTITARIIRFRWGKDVIDISRARGGRPAGWSLDTVPRSPASARTAAITFALAKALAALEPITPS